MNIIECRPLADLVRSFQSLQVRVFPSFEVLWNYFEHSTKRMFKAAGWDSERSEQPAASVLTRASVLLKRWFDSIPDNISHFNVHYIAFT